MLKSLVFVVPLFLFSTSARVEVMIAPSLEWLADHCFESGVYVVTDVKQTAGKDIVKLSLKLKKAYRGKPDKEIQQDYYKIRLSNPERALVKTRDEFLICWCGEQQVVQTINLDHPQAAGYSMIAASCELKLLKSKKEILKVFEDRLKSHPKGDPVEISDYSKDNLFELQGYTELFPAIYGGSSCYLRVPGDLVEKVKDASARQKRKAIEALLDSSRGPRGK